jgi:hypothetical protein
VNPARRRSEIRGSKLTGKVAHYTRQEARADCLINFNFAWSRRGRKWRASLTSRCPVSLETGNWTLDTYFATGVASFTTFSSASSASVTGTVQLTVDSLHSPPTPSRQ